MKTLSITKKDFAELVGSKFFTVTFYKKDGTLRKMQGRLGVKKGVKGTGAPKPDNIVTVYEVNSNRDAKTGKFTKAGFQQFRSFDVDRLVSVKVDGKTYE